MLEKGCRGPLMTWDNDKGSLEEKCDDLRGDRETRGEFVECKYGREGGKS